MAIEIKVLQRGDDSILMNVAPEVFDNAIDPELPEGVNNLTDLRRPRKQV